MPQPDGPSRTTRLTIFGVEAEAVEGPDLVATRAETSTVRFPIDNVTGVVTVEISLRKAAAGSAPVARRRATRLEQEPHHHGHDRQRGVSTGRDVDRLGEPYRP